MPIISGGGGGSGAVSSVFTRTGAVVATAGDYTGVAVGGTADALKAGALTNAMVDNAAAIAKSKLAALAIVNADVDAAAALALSKLADPTTGKVVGSVASAAAAVYPPGYEWNYTQITSTVNVTGTTEAGGTTIISPGAITFDGAPVLCEFFCYSAALPTAAVGNRLTVCLFESATEIARLALVDTQATTSQPFEVIYSVYRFTPTAGAHTYTITAFVSSTTGTPAIQGGPAGTAAHAPAFVRFVKV